MKKKLIITISTITVFIICSITIFLVLRSNLKTTYTSANAKDFSISPQGEVSFVVNGVYKTYDDPEIIEEALTKDEFYKLGKDGGRYRYKVVVYDLQDKVIAYRYTLKEA